MHLFATIKDLQVIIIHMKIDTIQCDTMQYNAIRYNTIQYNTIQYNTIQYNTIQYNINLKAKNEKENTPNYSGRDSIKGSS